MSTGKTAIELDLDSRSPRNPDDEPDFARKIKRRLLTRNGSLMFKIAKPPSSFGVLQAVIEAVGREYLSKDLDHFRVSEKEKRRSLLLHTPPGDYGALPVSSMIESAPLLLAHSQLKETLVASP